MGIVKISGQIMSRLSFGRIALASVSYPAKSFIVN